MAISGGSPLAGEDTCGAWLLSDTDPSGGQYAMVLRLRSCELHRGVSAFVQFKNNGSQHLKLNYLLHSSNKKPKAGEIELLPGETKRGSTCMACTRRKGGLKGWEIVTIESLGGEAVELKPTSPLRPTDPTQADQKEPSAQIEKQQPPAQKETPAVEKELPAKVPKVLPEKPVTKAAEANEENTEEPAKQNDEADDKTAGDEEDLINYDDLPPEFRPRGH